VLGGGDGIGLWLAKRLFARIPGMGRITLADVKPIARRGAPGGALCPSEEQT
jgi:hypothetical protein